MDFLQSLYQGTSCQVRVGDIRSRVFEVNVGLSSLFSLYINGLVKELKEASCEVECGGAAIPGLYLLMILRCLHLMGQGSRIA